MPIPTAAPTTRSSSWSFCAAGWTASTWSFPISGADRGHYEVARPNIAVPLSGADSALSLDGVFGFHRACQPLHELYQSGHVAVINATGLDEASRSHFDSQEYIERGTPGVRTTATGWLARHFSSAHNLPPEIIMPSVSVGNLQATSLLGDRDTVNMSDPDSFNLQIGPWEWRDAQRVALRHMYSGDNTWLHASGLQALDAMDIVELNTTGSYTPSNGAVYPSNSFGDGLQVIAQMIKLDLGLRVATLDLGGWDTHVSQGDNGAGYFSGLMATLAQGLAALYTDLDGAGSANYTQRLTMVVQSEFGRRLSENADRGTDHGHGNPMIVDLRQRHRRRPRSVARYRARSALRQRRSRGHDGFPSGPVRNPHPPDGQQPPGPRLPGVYGLPAPGDRRGHRYPPRLQQPAATASSPTTSKPETPANWSAATP